MLKATLVTMALTASLLFTSGRCEHPPNPALRSQFGDGTWDAGRQIQPGTYETREPGPECAWTVVAREARGRVLRRGSEHKVTLNAGEVFKPTACGIWHKR